MKWLDNLKIKYGSKYKVIKTTWVYKDYYPNDGFDGKKKKLFLYYKNTLRNVKTGKTRTIETWEEVDLTGTYVYLWW